MSRHPFKFVNNLKLRWKLLVVVLPLVVIPIIIVGSVVGYISAHQAYRGITQTSKDDLDHMAVFTLDLLNSHYQQFQVYKQDKQEDFKKDLATLADIAYSLVEAEERQVPQRQHHPQGGGTGGEEGPQARSASAKPATSTP